MATKQEALAALDAGYEKFRAGITDLPDEAYSEKWLGDWDLSQVLAHMTGWYREMAGAIDRVGRGERPAPEGVDYNDTETWNQKFAKEAKPGRSAFAEWEAAYQQYREAAGRLGDDLYGIDPEKGRPRIGNRLLDGAGINHFAEHQPDLDEWLKSRR